MNFWEQVQAEEKLVFNEQDVIETAVKKVYTGEVLAENNEGEIPQTLFMCNNNCKWIPTKCISEESSIPEYLFNQYFQ